MKFSFRFLIAVLALLAVSCGKKEEQTDSPAIVTEDRVIKDLSVIVNSPNRQSFVGAKVEVDNVVVNQVVGDVLFIAGYRGAGALPMSDTAELRGLPNPVIKAGQVLRIVGKVGDLSNPENPAKFWRLINNEERNRIMPAKVYISAEQITILSGVTVVPLP